MKLRIEFHPLLFQASLAAGGVALMAFNYLQFALPHDGGLITLSDIQWGTFTTAQSALYGPLVAVMLLFTFLTFALTAYFLWRLAGWLLEPGAYSTFISNPHKNQNAGIFAIVASLAMTLNVFWAPFGFFVPQLSSNMQALMLPSLAAFIILWLALIFLEVTVGRTWFSKGVDRRQFNFIWLLDVFAFSLVILTGSGITATANNDVIAGIAAVITALTLAVGATLLILKLGYLLYTHVTAAQLPANPILPGFFLIVPIACLLGLSGYRLAEYLQPHLAFNLPGSSSILITASYTIAVLWALAAVYVVRDYFKSYFVKSPFAPPQWGLV